MEDRYAINTESSMMRTMGNTLSRKNDSFIKISTEFTVDNDSPNQNSSHLDTLKESRNNITVDVSRKNLKALPPLNDYKDIERIVAEGNQISLIDNVPETLRELNLKENRISFFPKALKMAINLEILNLSHNRIISLEGLRACTKVKELYLAYNYISDEQLSCLEPLKDLEILDISHNHIKEEGAILLAEKMPRLRIFLNNMNEYTEVSFKNSSNVIEEIYLDENSLYTLEFHQPKRSLTTLSINRNKISEIIGINNLPNLENLNCENNKLRNLDILRYTGGLKTLNASSNGVLSILVPPKNLAERIDLSVNDLTNMEFVKECLNLKYLNLADNKIDSFFSSSSIFSNLTFLDLSKNKLKEIYGLERFPNLMELNLSFNQFSDINSLIRELAKLKKITTLDMRANKFNIHYDFDSIIPHGGTLGSLEALEKILKPSSEAQFNNFIQYRYLIISHLPDSLLTLDRITITSYEISLTQYQAGARSPIAQRSGMLSPTPTIDATLNMGGPSLFDANMTGSIDTALSNSAMFLSDKKQQGTGAFNPLQSDMDDSLAYSKGPRSQNTTAHKRNAAFTPPPKSEQDNVVSPSEISNRSKARYQQQAESERASQVLHSTLGLQSEDLGDSFTRSFRKSVTMLVGPELQKINKEKPTMQRTIVFENVPEGYNSNNYGSNSSAYTFSGREKRSQSLTNNPMDIIPELSTESRRPKHPELQSTNRNQSTDRNALPPQNVRKESFGKNSNDGQGSSKMRKLSDQLEISKQLVSQLEQSNSKRKESFDVYQSVQSDASDISEIANELTQEYQKQLEELKNNVKAKLKKLKSKGSEKSQEHKPKKQREQPEKTPSPIKREIAQHAFKKRQEIQEKYKQVIEEEIIRKDSKSRDTSKANIPAQNLSTEEMSHIDEFFSEKLIERLESDERIASNPYYQLYKDMLKKNRLSTIEKYIGGKGSSNDSDRREMEKITQGAKSSQTQTSTKTSPLKLTTIDFDDNARLNPATSFGPKKLAEKAEKKEPAPLSQHNSFHNRAPSRQTTPNSTKVNHTQTSPSLERKESVDKKRGNTKERTPSRGVFGDSQRSDRSNQSILSRGDPRKQQSEYDSNPNTSKKHNSTIKTEPFLQKYEITDSGDESPLFDIALGIFKQKLPKGKNYLSSMSLLTAFKDILSNFQVDIEDNALEELFEEIDDFIPRKITEQAFIDLFHLPKLREFLVQHNIPLHETARFAGISRHAHESNDNDNSHIVPERLSKISRNNSVHSISMISNNNESFLRVGEPSTQEKENNKFQSNKKRSLNTTLDLSKNNPDSYSNQKQKYFHSLTGSDMKLLQKQQNSGRGSDREEKTKIGMQDLYDPEIAANFLKLIPYGTTPPRPIFSKESQQNILKDIVPSSPEFGILSRIMNHFGFDLRRVLKVYSYNQHKKLSNLINEKGMVSPAGTPQGMSAHKKINFDQAVTLGNTSMKFDDKILLFHSAKLNVLSQLVENPLGFKDVYKERPGDLIFSHRTQICYRTYKRFFKKLEKRGGNQVDSVESSFINANLQRPTWRLLVSFVYLGNCYIEKQMNFKEFAYFGEIKVLELLRDGYTSIFFEKNDLYLVLLAEHCIPIYLCEYQFDNAN